MPLDVSGLTLDDALARLGTPAGAAAGVRTAYSAAFRGPECVATLTVRAAPVIRSQRDGDLIKFVQRLNSGLEVESVLIPMGNHSRRWQTICVSSQVGCAMGCTFCETAQLGLLSNLTADEIVGQVVAARRAFQAEPKNVVFMGMGEPFDNFDAVIQAVRVMNDPSGLSIARGRITISTVGRAAGIRRLAAMGWRRINLAVSLNAPNDRIRAEIMPIAKAESMAGLREAMLEFPQRRGAAIMIEYVLIPGVNDVREHAMELADFVRPIRACVNVIPYNPRRDSPWPAPSEESVDQFLDWLMERRIFCKRRITKGRDFMAACGQLGNRDLVSRGGRLVSLAVAGANGAQHA